MDCEELCRRLGALQVTRFIESLAGARERREHHSVPRSDNLVVDRWTWAARARVEQCFASVSQLHRSLCNRQAEFLCCFLLRASLIQNVLAFEFSADVLLHGDIATGIDSVCIFEDCGVLLTQYALDFCHAPDVKNALTGFLLSKTDRAVGVLRRGETAARLLHLTEREIENVP